MDLLTDWVGSMGIPSWIYVLDFDCHIARGEGLPLQSNKSNGERTYGYFGAIASIYPGWLQTRRLRLKNFEKQNEFHSCYF